MALMSRAIRNLLHNAREASVKEAELLRLTQAEDDVLIEVLDEGQGLPMIRPSIFEPFETTRPTGTGLGLAIVQKVAEIHRGQFSSNREDGAGCVARLKIARQGQS